MSTERRPVAFNKFGGLRLDLPIDEIGGEAAQYLRDVDWDGNTGRLRPRDGFAKLKAADATGPYKALFSHSATRLLATKRVSASSVKLVAIDKAGVEQKETTWPETAATACFARYGLPGASYTYCRAGITSAKVVRFDGAEFKEPTCSVDGATGKEMPRGKFMAAWMAGGERLVVANTAGTGGPGGAVSSNSHVWFSEPATAEGYESTAYVQVSVGDGEEITGLAVYGGVVFVFKETKFFRFYGVDTDEEGRPIFRFTEVSLGEGSRMKRPTVTALAESSDQLACTSSEGVYFCTSAGVFLTTGGPPAKVSQALRPLEEVSPFDGPMAEFLNGSTETFRWPATGIACLGSRLIVRRYEFMFILDIPTGEWTCWKMPAVSIAIWTGLTGGGGELVGSTAGTVVDEEASGLGFQKWTNPTNAQGAADGNFATATTTGLSTTHWLKATNFGFAIPTTATIVGIQLALARQCEGGTVRDEVLSPVKGGTPVKAENRASPEHWPVGVTATKIYGGQEDLWGNTWAPTDINATGFGMAVSPRMEAATAKVEAFTITVYYLTAEAASGVRPRLFCAQSKSIFYTAPGTADEAATRDAEWQSGFYDLGSEDEKDLVGMRAFGTGTIEVVSYSDLDASPSIGSDARLEFPGDGSRSVLDGNGLTDRGVMFAHRLSLEPGSRIQRLARYLRETRTPMTTSR
jgi:hypothetical protein